MLDVREELSQAARETGARVQDATLGVLDRSARCGIGAVVIEATERTVAPEGQRLRAEWLGE